MNVLRVMTVVSAAVLLLPSCASLEGLRALVQPPTFRQTDQPAEVRLAGPSVDRPFGGATVRLWTEVTNPNPFGFTLGTLDGTLFLEGSRAAAAAFPLGLPLGRAAALGHPDRAVDQLFRPAGTGRRRPSCRTPRGGGISPRRHDRRGRGQTGSARLRADDADERGLSGKAAIDFASASLSEMNAVRLSRRLRRANTTTRRDDDATGRC